MEGLKKFGLNMFPPAIGQEVHAALLRQVAAGELRPLVGRRIDLDGVASALEDHAHRRTTGRTVVELAR
jgi:NADPH2:quinone reductase